MDYKNLIYETSDQLTTIVLNRPRFHNALSFETLDELRDAIERARRDTDTKVILITGMGEKTFSAGADISELTVLDPIQGKEGSLRGQALFRSIENLGKPTIAVINGLAIGGGLELALACTMRVASSNAKLGLPEVGLGIMPGYGGTQRLSRLVGKGWAMEIILSSELIDAQEAYRIGLINKIFLKENLMEQARAFAGKFAQKGAIALRLATEAIHHGLDLSLEEGLNLEALLAGIIWASEDAKEGTQAFLQKRRPIFKNK